MIIGPTEMRRFIEAPDHGYDTYGKWGCLNKEQRDSILFLLNAFDSADFIIQKLYKENEKLKIQNAKLEKQLKNVFRVDDIKEDTNAN